MIPDELVARAEIEDVLLRYAHGVDRRDWELVRSTYHPDARDQHGPFDGLRDDLIAWLESIHIDIAFSAHTISNVLISFEGLELAHVETYAVTRQITRPGASSVFVATDGDALHTVGYCRYLDRFERRNGRWAIADRVVVFDAMTALSGVTQLPMDADWALGRRDADDPACTARRIDGSAPIPW